MFSTTKTMSCLALLVLASRGLVDVDAGFTLAYVMNRMGEGTVGDDRAHTLLRAIYASLDNA